MTLTSISSEMLSTLFTLKLALINRCLYSILERFLSIQNQFFVTIANDGAIKNGIAEALYSRIVEAHTKQKKFRVYVVLPLLPGFSGQNAVQAVLYFIMRSINKGEMSLYQRLKKAGESKVGPILKRFSGE